MGDVKRAATVLTEAGETAFMSAKYSGRVVVLPPAVPSALEEEEEEDSAAARVRCAVAWASRGGATERMTSLAASRSKSDDTMVAPAS